MINHVHNGAPPPTIVSVLNLAHLWGKFPWEIVGEDCTETVKQKWFDRAAFYYRQIDIRDRGITDG